MKSRSEKYSPMVQKVKQLYLELQIRKSFNIRRKSLIFFNCKRFGHYIKNCPSFIKPDSSGPGYKDKVVEAEESAFHGVSGPSVKHPLEHQWLIDSGASNHMTRERMLLADFKELDSPEKVGIADGRLWMQLVLEMSRQKWTCKAKRQSLL